MNIDEQDHANPSFSTGRKFGIIFHLVVAVGAALALAAMVNYLAHRHTFRLYTSEKAAQKLSPLTLQVLNSLTNSIKIIAFFDRTETLFPAVSALLKEYQSRGAMIDLEFVDYRMPGRAEAVRNQYKLTAAGDRGKVIFDSGNQVRTVLASELSDYGAMTNREFRRTGFKGEQLFTQAILNVTQNKPVTAYFMQGHGEHNPASDDEQRGFSRFVALVENNNIQIKLLPPMIQPEVPRDCELLIIASPEQPLSDIELRALQAYLARGGRMFVMFSAASMGVNTGLEQLLAQWDIAVGQDWVQDRAESQAGQSAMLVASTFGSHPIVRPLANSSLTLVMPRTVRHRPRAQSTPDSPRVLELAFSSSTARRLVPRANGYYPAEEGVLPVMVAAEKGTIQGVQTAGGAARMVVTGDSLFMANLGFNAAANADFANLAISWLCNRDSLMNEIGPNPVTEYEIRLTERQMSQVRWLLLGAIPGGVMTLGFLVWLKRRS